jgi:hypothetical protein
MPAAAMISRGNHPLNGAVDAPPPRITPRRCERFSHLPDHHVPETTAWRVPSRWHGCCPAVTQLEAIMRTHNLRRFLLLTVVTTGLMTAPAVAGPQQATGVRRYEQFTEYFARRTDEYVALHRRLERLVGPETLFVDPREDYANREALADLLRAARPGSAEGDFFCPDVAEVFRVRIAHTLRAIQATAVDVLRDNDESPYEEGWPDGAPLVVNGRFDWRLGNAIRPSLLHALPRLPEELEYRFVGADLVLLDVHANMVVDILRDALTLD